MNRERILSTSRRDLKVLMALAIPLILVAACGGSQSTSGTGGATPGTGGAVGGSVGTGGAVGTGGVGGHAAGGGGKAGLAGNGGNAAGQSGAGGVPSGGVGGGSAGTSGHGGAGGGGSSCATATSGAACSSEGMTCGGPCTDACQFCNLLRCTGGHWQAMEAAPAPCFTCGDGKCQTMQQYCKTTQGGPAGSVPTHTCVAIPTECLSMRTCACLANQATPGQCTMGSNGELMTLLQAP